jgi:Ni,Fe-hydrogenase III large subunit
MSFCGRLRGDFLNLTAMLCGNRFSRGLIRPGGIGISIDRNVLEELRERLNKIFQETKNAVSLLWHTPSVLARLELCGILPVQTARLLGTVGPAARASGLERDVRSSFPVQELAHKTITGIHGDVYARARVRWLEMKNSREIMLRLIDELSDLKASDHEPVIRPGYLAAALVEGWRGEICHTAITDSDGRFKCYKIVDPSFHNWPALAQVLRNGQISNFPLCNKSFNLSYCGHDL